MGRRSRLLYRTQAESCNGHAALPFGSVTYCVTSAYRSVSPGREECHRSKDAKCSILLSSPAMTTGRSYLYHVPWGHVTSLANRQLRGAYCDTSDYSISLLLWSCLVGIRDSCSRGDPGGARPANVPEKLPYMGGPWQSVRNKVFPQYPILPNTHTPKTGNKIKK